MTDFPFSESQVIDDSVPTDGTLGTAIDDMVRETRQALNWIYDRANLRHFRNVALVPQVQSVDVRGDKFIRFSMSETPHTLVQLTGGFNGQIIYCLLAEDDPPETLVWHHNPDFIKLTDGRDFHMAAGDMLVLRNVGGDLEGNEGHWEEMLRTIGGAVHGFISPGGGRYKMTVTDLGAIQVEGF